MDRGTGWATIFGVAKSWTWLSNYHFHFQSILGLPWWLGSKEFTCQCRTQGFNPWIGKIPWRRKWQPTPVFLSGKSHGQRSLAGYSLWGPRIRKTTTKPLPCSVGHGDLLLAFYVLTWTMYSWWTLCKILVCHFDVCSFVYKCIEVCLQLLTFRILFIAFWASVSW